MTEGVIAALRRFRPRASCGGVEAQSQANVEHLFADLAADLVAIVPEAVFLVRVEEGWTRLRDSAASRRWAFDFARESEGPTLAALHASANERAARSAWRHVELDREWARDVYECGERWLRIWPARSLLVEAMCEVLRVDIQAPCNADTSAWPTLRIPVGPIVERLGIDEGCSERVQEIFYRTDDLAQIHAWRYQWRGARGADFADRLKRLGFQRDGEGWQATLDSGRYALSLAASETEGAYRIEAYLVRP